MALEERRRLLEHCLQSIALLALGLELGRRLLVLHRDPEALGQPLDRIREVEVLGLAHERDDVAALAAAEAVVELVRRVHREARSALLVEGAATGIASTRPAQRSAARDDLDHVRRGDNLANRRLLD